MTTEQRNALERMVETFEQGSMVPMDLDLDSPEMKAILDMMDESRRNTFLAMAKDPDIRKMSNVFNSGLSKYWQSVLAAKDQGKKVVKYGAGGGYVGYGVSYSLNQVMGIWATLIILLILFEIIQVFIP